MYTSTMKLSPLPYTYIYRYINTYVTEKKGIDSCNHTLLQVTNLQTHTYCYVLSTKLCVD